MIRSVHGFRAGLFCLAFLSMDISDELSHTSTIFF
jgi:hypothetical protein